MATTRTPDSGTRNRTRRAILDAAAGVLARNRSASLADVAEAADVGRSTLHRYFADRENLIDSVVADSYRAIERSVVDADVTSGEPLEAVRRLVAGMVELGDRLLFLFADPRTAEEYAAREPDAPPLVTPVIELIERGQRAGVFADRLSPLWIQHVLWSLVYAGCELSDRTPMSRHEVASMVIDTLEHGIVGATGRDRTGGHLVDDRARTPTAGGSDAP